MEIKLAFKGFNTDLSCRGEKYEEGITYFKICKNRPTLCTSDGYHYCNKISQVNEFYTFNHTNRFCIIEVIGEWQEDKSKGITTSFRIVKEITDLVRTKKWEEIDILYSTYKNDFVAREYRDINEVFIKEEIEKRKQEKILKDKLRKEIEEENKVKIAAKEEKIALNLGLCHARKLQQSYPLVHICGSLGLFLHGVRLKRFETAKCNDLDVISPYFMLYENVTGLSFEHKEAKASGNDFDQTFIMTSDEGSTKVDVRIDPRQAYEVIEYGGFKYKVSKLETILNAKMKYAMNRQDKHLKDIYEIAGKIK